MRRVFSIVLASAALGCAAPALAKASDPIPAAPVLSLDNVPGTPESSQIFGIKNDTSATLQYGSSPDNTDIANVTFTGNGGMTIKNGFAQLIQGSSALSVLIIDPTEFDFSEMKFAVQLGGTDGSNTQKMDVYALLTGASIYTFLGTVDGGHGDDVNFEVAGGSMDALKIMTDSSGVYFSNVKQVSYEPLPTSVPEPTTWGMMLIGFGGIGAAMRRGRNRSRTLQQIA